MTAAAGSAMGAEGSASDPAARRLRPIDLFVPIGSVVLLAMMVALILSAAGSTLGYDFDAYIGAARRLTSGAQLYDTAVSTAGGHAIYLYPPPFAVAFVPFLALPDAAARVLWCSGMAACLPLGALLLPVRRDVRWIVVMVAAFNWPFLYAVKLGQVSPLLFLVFAAAWRCQDRVLPLGASMAIGALVKVQPGLLIVWALVTRRWRAAVAAAGVCVAVVAVTTVFTGIGAWSDYIALLGRVSDATTAERNASPGAMAHGAGLSLAAAGAVQSASTVLVGLLVLLAWRFAKPDASLMVTILASQLVTPLLWDHYAVLLLLPMAWLANRGRMWVVVIPFLDWIALGATSSWAYLLVIPLSFYAFIFLVLLEDLNERRRPAQASAQGA